MLATVLAAVVLTAQAALPRQVASEAHDLAADRPVGADSQDAGRVLMVDTSWAGGFTYTRSATTGLMDEGSATVWARVTNRDALGRPTRTEAGATGVVTASWDTLGRIDTWSGTDGVSTDSRSWFYDDRGRATEVDHADASGVWTEERDYVEPGWLVGEKRTDSASTVYDERAYEYDSGGNRTKTTKNGVVTDVATYDGSFLTSVDGAGVSWERDGIAADAAGRAILRAADGSEEGLDVPAGPSYRFGRDPWGRPVWTDDGGSTREQVWGNPGGAWPLAGVDENGDPTLQVAVDGMLVGVVTAGVFEPAASDPAGNVAFIGTEWLGTPDAFGEGVTPSVTTTFRHVFAGLEVLPDTGGYQLAQHRLYDGGIGRFERMDPLGVRGGPSRFAYAENDPASRWDPTGLSSSNCGGAVHLPQHDTRMEPVEAIAAPVTFYETETLLAEAGAVQTARTHAGLAAIDATSLPWAGGGGTGPVGGPPQPEGPGGPMASGWDALNRVAPGAAPEDEGSEEGEDEVDGGPETGGEKGIWATVKGIFRHVIRGSETVYAYADASEPEGDSGKGDSTAEGSGDAHSRSHSLRGLFQRRPQGSVGGRRQEFDDQADYDAWHRLPRDQRRAQLHQRQVGVVALAVAEGTSWIPVEPETKGFLLGEAAGATNYLAGQLALFEPMTTSPVPGDSPPSETMRALSEATFHVADAYDPTAAAVGGSLGHVGAASLEVVAGGAGEALDRAGVRAASRGAGGGYDFALGLSKHPDHARAGLVGRFSEHVGAKTYWDLFDNTSDMRVMGGNLLKGMREADHIHFNLDGMVRGGTSFDDLVKYGSDGIGQGNVTNWELYQIVKDPALRAKTTFYLEGVPYTP